jgi:low molecular weight phosphotyrosine protein phosphatase
MAEGVFESLTKSHPLIADVDSAGTASYHTGSSPDSRTMKTLRANGITKYQHIARRVTAADFERFDWIFAMDQENCEDLVNMRNKLVKKKRQGQVGNTKDTEDGLGKVMLWGSAGGFTGEQVVDPYYGVDNGFDVCFEQMIRFSKGFLKSLEESLQEKTPATSS